MDILKRLISPTPSFHAKARNIFGIAAIIIGITIATKPAFISENVIEVLKYIDALLVGVAGWAQTTIKDTPQDK